MGLLQGKIENIRNDLHIASFEDDYGIFINSGSYITIIKESIENYHEAEQLIKNDKWIIDTFLKDNFILV